MIEFQNVTKVFGSGETRVAAVKGLSFVCPKGSFYALTGPSGSGKSTVLHLVAGLTPPTEGTVRVDGIDIAKMTESETALLRRRRVGYVLQTFDLMPFLTARANIGMPLVLDGVPRREVTERVDEALALVNMAHRAAHDPTGTIGRRAAADRDRAGARHSAGDHPRRRTNWGPKAHERVEAIMDLFLGVKRPYQRYGSPRDSRPELRIVCPPHSASRRRRARSRDRSRSGRRVSALASTFVKVALSLFRLIALVSIPQLRPNYFH